MSPHRFRRYVRWLFLLVVFPVVALGAMSMTARRPHNLGVQANGRLADCPASPNCVCSQASDAAHAIEPIPFQGEPAAALARLVKVVEGFPRTRIVSATENYLHAEFTSLIFRFTDDVEFLVDPAARVIHCRSASRVGYSDLGANRRRIEAIRRAYE